MSSKKNLNFSDPLVNSKGFSAKSEIIKLMLCNKLAQKNFFEMCQNISLAFSRLKVKFISFALFEKWRIFCCWQKLLIYIHSYIHRNTRVIFRTLLLLLLTRL